jgi:hypothetical protein
MGVRSESLRWSDAVFIDNPQGAKPQVPWVVIPIEGERVIRIQPPVIEMPALISETYLKHRISPY